MRFKIGNYVMEHVKDDLIGQIVRHRYLFKQYIDEGSYGKVYEIMDLKQPSQPLVAKVSYNHMNFETEFTAMNIIYEVNKGLEELRANSSDNQGRAIVLEQQGGGQLSGGDDEGQQQPGYLQADGVNW
jgi:hypothetical protein